MGFNIFPNTSKTIYSKSAISENIFLLQIYALVLKYCTHFSMAYIFLKFLWWWLFAQLIHITQFIHLVQSTFTVIKGEKFKTGVKADKYERLDLSRIIGDPIWWNVILWYTYISMSIFPKIKYHPKNYIVNSPKTPYSLVIKFVGEFLCFEPLALQYFSFNWLNSFFRSSNSFNSNVCLDYAICVICRRRWNSPIFLNLI